MMRRAAPSTALLAALAILPLRLAWAAYDLPELEKIQEQVQTVATKASPSVVALMHRMKGGIAAGSGVVISRNGLVLTAAHVVSDQKLVDVIFPDGKSVRAKVLGADYERDVALAAITDAGDYPAVDLGDSTSLVVGDRVVALGHPGGFDPRRKPPVRFGRVFEFDHAQFIRSDCTLAGGDSGGPLFDLNGKVIGVHSSVGTDMSVNNDAPIEVVRAEWDRLMKGDRWGHNALSEKREPQFAPGELGGLNLKLFRKRLQENGLTEGGVITETAKIEQWLRECGMSERRLSEVRSGGLATFMAKVVGGIVGVGGDASETETSAKAGKDRVNADLSGLDMQKFRRRVVEEATKHNGAFEATPEVLGRWLEECGMSKEQVKTMTPLQLAGAVKAAMGTSGSVKEIDEGDLVPPTIVQQDQDVVAVVKPSLDKIAESVVNLINGKKMLTMGTIVRENGFILTKLSEIAKARGKLKARLWDGRELTARQVAEFSNYDLALLKVDADSLPAVTFSESNGPMKPGDWLFTAGGQKGNLMLAMGVVSVSDRSLRESGGYLGIALREGKKGVEIGGVIPGSPAAKAGLRAFDRIVSMDDVLFQNGAELSEHVRNLSPDTRVQLKYRRGEQEKTAEVTLADRGEFYTKPVNVDASLTRGTQVSTRRTGFPVIFQHDQPLRPEDCGSVVVDLHGNIVGVNIARVSRVDTYAIPAGEVARLLKFVDFSMLERKAEEAGRDSL